MGDELLEQTHHIMHHFSLEMLLSLGMFMLFRNEYFPKYAMFLLHLFNQDLGKAGILGVSQFTRAFTTSHGTLGMRGTNRVLHAIVIHEL
jgi:hypothetical protein